MQSLKATQTQRLTFSSMTHAKIAMGVHGESAHRIQVGTTKHSTQATRGARKEFPCVAVIVAKLTQVTIYDGDDPDCQCGCV